MYAYAKKLYNETMSRKGRQQEPPGEPCGRKMARKATDESEEEEVEEEEKKKGEMRRAMEVNARLKT